ncbi:PREDICTED: Golgi integral membrane protein 4 isoform X2 [Gekko japonicus]|uniref:Golgi integral membrane protein 4 isoform X2 n=1 Tax=Gekko japonicus TaxID=146911 RepID=A0ABM1LG60_GEKJA|nr:PREDICTED: Golgi integral membrane protein 4 isoform X2 [Gekko japonicus]
MGNGMCSRKQKRILQTLLLLTVVFGFIYGAMLYYEVQNQLRKAEAVALKYQQHQESLSAQLQVVYEHRSRLEKSLQKERLEHKKAKEDFLVYKLEAQETLNKGRQDSNNRYSALNVQHQMLKSQHEELKKVHVDLEEEHRKQAEDFSRAVNDHKQRYLEMQQEKGQELSKLKESLYNLREENRQLRKAHQDIHTQLQDVKSQVEEYRQLKDTLKKMPSFQRPESFHPPHVVQVTLAPSPSSDPKAHDSNVAEQQQEVILDGEHPQEGEGIHAEGREDRAVPFHPGGKAVEGHARQELNIQQKQEAGEDEEQHLEQVEEENKKELEEEEMEQAGQPERLAEDLDQTPEEREWKEKEEEINMLHEHTHLEEPATVKTITRYKSAYEEQLEQQRLAAQRAEEATRLREHQESLHQGRLQEQLLRQQQLQEKELSFRRQAEQDEEQFKHHLSQQSHYDNLDQDIVQGEEQGTQEEDENYVRHNQHPQEAEEEDQNNANEQRDQDRGHQAESEPNKDARKAAVDDVNPADDPNNQGEDEFEEAEQEREETLPEEDKPLKPHDQKQENPEVEEHLVMVGNPDQQEDNVDEQYQEEGEEEAQGDLTEEKKRDLERNGEEPYGENDENAEEKMSEGADQEQEIQEETNPKEGRDENYEEEEEEEEEGGAVEAKAHRRGEM